MEQLGGLNDFPIHDGSIEEVKLVSSDDWGGYDKLHILMNETDNDLILYRFDPVLLTKTWMATEITDCDRGLDAVAAPSQWFPVFISYFDHHHYAKVARYEATQSMFVQQYAKPTGQSQPDETALGQYGMDMVCVFEQYVMGAYILEVAYSSNLGADWGSQLITDADDDRYNPAITMRGGGGIALAYSKKVTFANVGRYKWQTYDDPLLGFVSPTGYADYWTYG